MATHIRHPGFVVLDAGCYQHLRDPTLRERMVSDLRLADLEIRPSTLNLLEIAKHPIVGKRKDLLRVMGTLRADRPITALAQRPPGHRGQVHAQGRGAVPN